MHKRTHEKFVGADVSMITRDTFGEVLGHDIKITFHLNGGQLGCTMIFGILRIRVYLLKVLLLWVCNALDVVGINTNVGWANLHVGGDIYVVKIVCLLELSK